MSKFTQRNPDPIGAPNEAVRFAWLSLQRTQMALIAMLGVCAVLGATLLRPAANAMGTRQPYLPVIFATTLLTFGFTVRNIMATPALAELRRNPQDGAALKRWARYCLIVQSLCAGVGLIGFAMQLMGAAANLSLALYAISVAYLVMLRPQRP